MKHIFQFVILCLFYSVNLFAQDLDSSQVSMMLSERNQYIVDKKFDKGIDVCLKLVAHFEQKTPRDNEMLNDLYNSLGTLHRFSGDDVKAIEYYEKSIFYARKMTVPDLWYEGVVSLNIGLIYFSQGAFDKADKFCQAALINIRNSNPDPRREQLEAKILVILGAIRGEQRKYEEENILLLEAFNIVKNLKEEWDAKLDVYLGLAINAGDRGDSEQEFKYVRIAQSLLEKYFPSSDNDFPRLYTTFANAYFHKKEYQKAIEYHRKTVAFYEKYYPPLYIESSIALENIGNCYSKMGEYKEAEYYLQEALKIHTYNYGEQSPRTAFAHQLLAENYADQRAYSEAMQEINLAFASLLYDRRKPFSFNSVSSPYTLLDIFLLKTRILLRRYKENAELDILYQLDSISVKSLALVDSIDLTQIDIAEQIALNENYYSVYELGIEIQYLLYTETNAMKHISSAFKLCERSKNNLLRKSIRNQTVLKKGGVSMDAIERESTLKTEYANLIAERSFGTSDSLEQILDTEIFQVKEAIWEERKKVLNEFSSIKDQFEVPFLNVSEVQEEMETSQEAIVQYFLGKDELFVWWISKEAVKFMKVDNPKALEKQINDFRELLYNPNSTECEKLNDLAYQLFLILFPSISEEELLIFKKLTIIPSGIIATIPFELLQTNSKSTDCLEASYLIKNLSIHYRYSSNSVTILKDRSSSSSFLGIAPSYNKTVPEEDTLIDKGLASLVRSGYYNLPGAINEVKQISDIMEGDFLIADFANESSFKKQAHNYKILHLAMHSIVNQDEPMLSHLMFSPLNVDSVEDNRLHAIELYNMNLEAELVVLSACNSGFGKIKKGEGALSLAHAFTYAGAPATVMSLWKVPDAATSNIMIDFYKNLKLGKQKDEALRMAKLAWLQNDQIPVNLKHPYYWAGFIVLGDMDPLIINENSVFFYSGIIAFLTVLVTFIFFFKKKLKSD